MVTARTLKGAQVYVTFYPDCEENVGGYYCQVYTDENCISLIPQHYNLTLFISS